MFYNRTKTPNVRENLNELKRDQRGNTALMFALLLLPIMMLVGMSVDVRRASNGKSIAQDSIDMASLAGARAFLDYGMLPMAERRAKSIEVATTTFEKNMLTAEGGLDVATVNFSFVGDAQMSGTATVNTPTTFSAIIGREFITSKVSADAEAGDMRAYEVVLVLDNTSSMFQGDRMEEMRAASKSFVETMFVSSPDPSLTKIGVVPVASLVNINVERPRDFSIGTDSGAAATPAPPAAGSGTIPNPPFESRIRYLRDPVTGGSISSGDVDALFEPVEWRGCIRAAPNERRVNSGGNVSGNLTDAPVSGMKWPLSVITAEETFRYIDERPPSPPTVPPADNSINNDDDDDDDDDDTQSTPPPPVAPPSPQPLDVQGALDHLVPEYGDLIGLDMVESAATDYYVGWSLWCQQNHYQNSFAGARNTYIPRDAQCTDDQDERYTSIVRACVSDPNEFEYISDGGRLCPWLDKVQPWNKQKAISGPNINCPTAMLGLSSSPTQLFEKLDHMYPVPGGTQMDVGMSWALRVLSPRNQWTSFFGYDNAQEPAPFNDPSTRKMVILLTDGENRPPFHYEGYYGCVEGDTRGGQVGPCWQHEDVADLSTDSLDALLIDSCEAMRDDYGIEVYTISVDVSDSGANATLQSCAGSVDTSFEVSSSDLTSTFQALARRTLRLTK